MAGLIPFNIRNNNLSRTDTGFEDFYNMLDDFFSGGLLQPSRNLLRDTFKIDITDKENEYFIEAELPGTKKEEIDLSVEDNSLCISINRVQEENKDDKNYIHRERKVSSMSRRVRLEGAKLNEISAKLKDGVLNITVPKEKKASSTKKINIG